MKENFEIEKELKFNSNIAEITSISLEEKHEVDNNCLKGTFIVSGEYKIHEISLNKEKFNYKIPFECDIKNDIDVNTVEMEVTDFTYDTDGDILYVTIAYDVLGDRKDILLFDDEENLEDFLKSREVEIIMDDTIKEINEVLDKPQEEVNDEADKVVRELNEIIEENEELEKKEEFKENSELDVKVQTDHDELKRNIEESKQELLNSVNVSDDNYITYQIHIVKSEDTLESILVKYNMTLDELKEYNEFNNLQLGDKLIIPVLNEE